MHRIEGAKLRYTPIGRPDGQSWWLIASTVKRALFAIVILIAGIDLLRGQATAQEPTKSSAATTLDPLKSDQVAQARKILLEAKAIAESSDNKDKDRVPWESLAVASARAGDAEGALAAARHVLESHRVRNTALLAMPLFAEMAFELSRLGMQAEAHPVIELAPAMDHRTSALRSLVEAQTRSGDVKLAQDTLNYMSQTLGSSSESKTEIERAKRNIAMAQAESGNVEAASRTAAQIQHTVMKMQAQCAVAVAQAAKGNRQAASGTLAEVDKEIPPYIEKFGESDLSTLRRIVQMTRVRIGDAATALKAAEKLPAEERPETKLMLATGLAYEGDVSAALRIFESYSDLVLSNPNNFLSEFLAIATQRLAVGDKAGAMKMCDFAIGIINKTEGSFQNVPNLTRIAVIQGKTGDSALAARTLTRAMEMVSKSQKWSDKERGYTSVATAQAELRNFEEAIRISRLLPMESQGSLSLNVLLSEIAEGQADAKQFDAARATISLFDCRPVDIRDRDKCLEWKRSGALGVFSEIAKEQAQARQFDEARKTASSVECPEGNMQDHCLQEREWTLVQLARTSAGLGDVANTLAWARQQDSPVVKANALVKIAEGLLDQVNPSANPRQYMSTFDTMDWP